MTDGWAKIRVAGNLRLQHRVADLENLLAQHGIDHHKHEGCERTMENPISETLRRKTAELEAIYRAYPDLQFRLRNDGTILDYHTHFEGELYLAPELFLGQRMQDVLPPDVGEQFKDAFEQITGGSLLVTFEYKLSLSTEIRFYEARILPLLDDQMILVARDVTSRRKTETDLQRNAEHHLMVLETIPHGIEEIDNTGRITYANAALHQMLGMGRGELLGRMLSETVVEPREERLSPESLHDLIERQHEPLPYWRWFRTEDGGALEAYVTWNYRRDNHGRVVGFISVITDVSRRRQVEAALRRSEQQFCSLFENSSEAHVVASLSGTLLEANQAMLQLFKISTNEVRSIELPQLYLDPDIHNRVVAGINQNDSHQEQHCRMLRRDGSLFDAAIIFDGRYGKTGQLVGLQGSVRDITDQQIAEQQFRQRSNDIAHASRISTAGELASGLSHELNQPLYAISNYAGDCRSVLDRQGSLADPNLNEWTQKIGEQATRASDIIRRMTNFIRKAEPLPTTFSVNDLMEEILKFIEVDTQQHQTHIDYRCKPPDLKIMADRILIEQVLVNLIRNGVEAMSDAPLNRRQLSINACLNDEQNAVISVQDLGRGVAAESVEQLFEPFYTTKPEGLGLGLAISRSIIESHQGKMWAETNSDAGLTFFVRLPHLVDTMPDPPEKL